MKSEQPSPAGVKDPSPALKAPDSGLYSRRGVAPLLAILALSPGVTTSEAGLFKKMKERRQQRARQRSTSTSSSGASRTYRSRPRQRSWYRDEHQDAYLNQPLLETRKEASRKVVIDIGRQRAFLIVEGLVAIDSAVSTARRGKITPRGSYRVTEKVRSGKISTLYHVYMPNWMRLGNTAVGMHMGDLPGYPASAGCIRLPQSVAPVLYDNIPKGTLVEIVDTWNESDLAIPYTAPHSLERSLV